MIIWLLVSTATPTALPAALSSEKLKIDILVKQPEPECEPGEGDEIVVCAEMEDNERHRLRPIPNAEKYREEPLKAEVALSENATMSAENEAGALGDGVTSNRLMVRLKVAF